MSKRDPKELVLDTALATFATVGYAQATIAEIRTRAGISNGALFHHFPSKDAIAEALYLRGIASYQEGLLRALDRHRGTDARATIRAAVHHHLAWVEANRDLAWFMYERGRPDWQPAHGAAVRKLNRSTAVHIKDWIAPLASAGVVRRLPLAVLAACVVGPSHFIARRWLSHLITARPTSFADALADAAWAALAPSKPRRGPEQPRRPSSAALIEFAAIEAACAACPTSEADQWTIAQLSMGNLAGAMNMQTVAQVQSIRVESGGHIALIDVDLVDADGVSATRGHVVCLRSASDRAERGEAP
jgi:AcrR family transcriptional regulator